MTVALNNLQLLKASDFWLPGSIYIRTDTQEVVKFARVSEVQPEVQPAQAGMSKDEGHRAAIGRARAQLHRRDAVVIDRLVAAWRNHRHRGLHLRALQSELAQVLVELLGRQPQRRER